MNEVFRLFATIQTNGKAAVAEFGAAEAAGKTAGARLGTAFTKLAKIMKVVFIVGAAAATFAMGKFFVSSIKSAAEYEQKMAMVKSVTGATGKEFDALGKKAKELGKTTKFTMTDIAEGMENLGRAGMTANEIIDSMAGVTALAASQSIELGQAAEMTAGALNGFHLAADQAGRVADVYAYAASNSAIRTEDLAETLKYAMPAAYAAGYSFEQVAGMAMKMGDSMVKGSMAGTSLNFAFSELVGMSDEFKEKLGEVGVSVSDLTGPDGKLLSMAEILGVLKAKGLDAGDMFELFGKRAGKGMAILLEEGEDAIKDYTTSLEECGGTAEEMAKIQLDTLSGQVEILRGSWELLKVTVGERLMPILKNFLKETIIPLVNKMVNLAKESDTLEKGFTSFIGGVKNGIEWIVEHRESLVKAVKAITVGFIALEAIKIATWCTNAIAGFVGLEIAMGPVALVLAGIAALGYAFYELGTTMKSGLKEGQLAFEEWSEMSEESLMEMNAAMSQVALNTLEQIRAQIEAEERAAFEQEMIRRGVIVVDQEVTDAQKKELDEREEDYDKYVKQLGEKTQEAGDQFEKMEEALHSASEGTIEYANAVQDLQKLYDELSKYQDYFVENNMEVNESILDLMADIEALDVVVKKVGKEVKTGWTGVWNEFKTITENGAKIIRDVWSGLSEFVGDTLGDMLRGVFNYFRDKEQAAKDHSDRMLGIEKDYAESSEDLQGTRQDKFKDTELTYQREVEDIETEYRRALQGLTSDDVEERERIETRYREDMQDAATAYARRREDIEKDYTDAVGDLTDDRKEAIDDEIQAYEDSVKPIWEALWEIAKAVLAAAREELWILSVVEAAKAAAYGAAALLGGLWAVPLAAQHAAAAVAALVEAGLLTFGGFLTGFKEGVLAFGPTLGVIGEGPTPEAAIPLTPPILANIGKGIVSALQGVEPAYAYAGGGGIAGAQVVIEEMHVAKGAVFHVREEADIEKIAKELGDEFDDRIIGKGRVTA